LGGRNPEFQDAGAPDLSNKGRKRAGPSGKFEMGSKGILKDVIQRKIEPGAFFKEEKK